MDIAGDDIDRLLENEMNKSEKKRHRSRSRHRSRHKSRKSHRHRSRSPSNDRDRHKRLELYNRDECTVFACHIHPAVDDKDIFEFFSQCGTVIDIVLMRDNQSGTSKGYCYIEFKDKEAVVNALTINGQYLGGSPIMVTVASADKARYGTGGPSIKGTSDGPVKLYVSNLDEAITADDLDPIFSAFGAIEAIYVDKKVDKATGTKSGFVEFRSFSEATFALTNLNNMPLLDKKLRISQSNLYGGANPPGGAIPGLSTTSLDDGQGGLQMNQSSRVMLMQRLQASGASADGESNGFSAGPYSKPVPKKIQSKYVLLKNMFDPNEETEPNWEKEIEEDVRLECSKFGVVEKCVVDKNSMGHTYLIFKDLAGAIDATNQLNGRWFSQKQIIADMIDYDTFQRMCPKYIN